ncbi:MAG: PPC domain-containing protein [Verrucomicrobiaceae bacterium]|nr:PPC domain-containing protein [Verrucomicrobiaceae bacterium]
MRKICLLFLFSTTILHAAYPDFGAFTPKGLQRGTDTKVTVHGARLADFEGLIFYSSGFTVKSIEKKEAAAVVLTLAVAPEVPLGLHSLRVRTASGISHLRQITVGPYPTVNEAEPNSDFASPQVIGLNQTIEGVVTNEDVDHYRVTMKKGQTLTVELEGQRLGYTPFDPFVSIMNTQRFDLATCDDTPLLGKDPYASIIVPQDGDYIIQVREASYVGNDSSVYRLHVGEFRRPAVVFPAGGKVGSTFKARFLSITGEAFEEDVTLPAQSAWPFILQPKQQPAPSGIPFRLVDFDNVMEVEPNDEPAKATPTSLPLSVAFNGIIEKPGDMDFFKLTLKKDQQLEFIAYAQAIGSPLDPILLLVNAQGAGIVENDDAGDTPRLDSRFKVTVPADGDYILRVMDQLERGGPAFVYRIEVTGTRPEVILSSPNYEINDTQSRQFIPVPRGGRFAQLINITRSGTGGDASFVCEGLPAGVRLVDAGVPGGFGSVLALFEAAPDAPLSGGAMTMTLKHNDPANGIIGRLRQVFDLVREGNNLPLHRSIESQMPIAVVEEAPFALEIAKPVVPLVQAGVIEMKVSAKRKDGFKAPILVRLLWKPPGINALGEQTIPEGQSECTFVLDANGDAPAGIWKLAVLGQADAGNGTTYNASPFTDLVTAPMMIASATPALTVVEQGQSTGYLCKLEQRVPFEGEATATLYGLPDTLPVAPVKFTKVTADLVFQIPTKPDSAVTKHANLFVQTVVPTPTGPLLQRFAFGGTLRVDAPPKMAPPPPAPPPAAPVVAAVVPPPPAAPPPPKLLTRLEQLREKLAKTK